MAKPTKRSVSIKQGTLLKLVGVEELTETMQDLMSRAKGEWIKKAYLDGAKVIWKAAKRNVKGLPISDRGKQQLDATIIMNRLKPWDQKVMVGCNQPAGIKKLEREGVQIARVSKDKPRTPGLFVGNPYWWEFGTSRGQRKTPFFRPAVINSRPEVKKVLTEQISKALFGDLD